MRQSRGQHDPHRCAESATIIHYYPKDRKKINGFLLTGFAQRNWREKEIHLLSEGQRRETLLQ